VKQMKPKRFVSHRTSRLLKRNEIHYEKWVTNIGNFKNPTSMVKPVKGLDDKTLLDLYGALEDIDAQEDLYQTVRCLENKAAQVVR
jgi:hypothetical protein